MSYIFGRNAGECSFFGLYSMENIGEWAVHYGDSYYPITISIGYLIIQLL